MRWRILLPWLLAVCALVLALAFLAFHGRYELRGTSRGWVYRMDRWTGEVLLIERDNSYRIKSPEATRRMEEAKAAQDEAELAAKERIFKRLQALRAEREEAGAH